MNVGNLVRSAHAFGASFVFTVAAHPKAGRAPSDTSKTHSQVPFYRWQSVEEMVLPADCALVGVELLDDAIDLPSFRHPSRAAYVFGPERGALSPAMHVLYGGDGPHFTAFLAAYPDKDVVDRYRRYSAAYHWRLACYCHWQVSRNRVPAYGPAYEAEMADPNPDKSVRCDCKSDKVPWDEVRAVMPAWYFEEDIYSGRHSQEVRKLNKELRALKRDFHRQHCKGS